MCWLLVHLILHHISCLFHVHPLAAHGRWSWWTSNWLHQLWVRRSSFLHSSSAGWRHQLVARVWHSLIIILNSSAIVFSVGWNINRLINGAIFRRVPVASLLLNHFIVYLLSGHKLADLRSNVCSFSLVGLISIHFVQWIYHIVLFCGDLGVVNPDEVSGIIIGDSIDLYLWMCFRVFFGCFDSLGFGSHSTWWSCTGTRTGSWFPCLIHFGLFVDQLEIHCHHILSFFILVFAFSDPSFLQCQTCLDGFLQVIMFFLLTSILLHIDAILIWISTLHNLFWFSERLLMQIGLSETRQCVTHMVWMESSKVELWAWAGAAWLFFRWVWGIDWLALE